MKIGYFLVVGIAALAFVLQADWLFYVAFAALLLIALVNYKKGASPLPAGMGSPFQARRLQTPGGFQALPLPKKKKKIRRPIIIIQPPSHSDSVTKGVLDEAIKKSFPDFMTPQQKRQREEEQRGKAELMNLLKEQNKQIGELRDELERVPGYRRRRRESEDDD